MQETHHEHMGLPWTSKLPWIKSMSSKTRSESDLHSKQPHRYCICSKKSQDLGNWLEIKLRGHLLKQFKQAILFQISIIHTYFTPTPHLSFYQYFQCLWEQVHIQISQWRKTSRENLRASWSWNCQSMSDIRLFPSCNVWTVSESERYQQGEL